MFKISIDKIFLISLFIPQFILRLPLFPEIISTVDLIGSLILFFCLLKVLNGHKVDKGAIIYIMFFIYLCLSFILSIFWTPSLEFHIASSPYLLRNLFIFSALFFNYSILSKLVHVNSIKILINFSLIFNLWIMVAYYLGIDIYNSTHTWTTIENLTINRLGGLPNETGAYGFNCLIISFFYIMFNLSPNKSFTSNFFTLLFFTFFLFFAYVFSLARIILLGYFMFIFFLIFHANFFGSKGRFFLLITSLFIFIILIYFYLYLDVESEFLIRLVGSKMLDDITSSRLSHWDSAISSWYDSIYTIFFGYGFRTTKLTLGMPIENFFVLNLFEIGVIGLFVEIIFFIFLLVNIFKIQSNNSTFNFQVNCLKYMWVVVFIISQLNDVITYFQTLPLIIGITLLYCKYNFIPSDSKS